MEQPTFDNRPAGEIIFQDSRIRDGVFYPRPKPCIAHVGGGDELIFATPGNLSLIKGAEKSGKSFFKSMLLAAAMRGRSTRHIQSLVGRGLENKIIVEVDTEQDETYVAWNRSRTLKMVGVESLSNYITVSMRAKTYLERMQGLTWLFEQSPARKNLGLVFIDGFVDLIADFNDNKQSRELVEQLMKWSQSTGAHISGIIHTNPGDPDFKARGHLGTMLQQKCETVAVVSYDKNARRHQIECQRSRGRGWENIGFEIVDAMPFELDPSEIIV